MLYQETSAAVGMASLVPWVVFLPVIGLVINLLIGKRLGEKGIGVVASLASGGAFMVAVLLALHLSAQPEAVQVPFLTWITVGSMSADWVFRVDTLSVTMMVAVTLVGTLIHIYAIGYMHDDVRHNGEPARFQRFFVFFNLFIVSMMILVSADNYLMMFVGWEGVGLCSYLLIGFWFEKGAGGIANAQAAKKAFVVNRIGDFGFLLAMIIIFWNFGTFQFDKVFAQAVSAAPLVISLITLLMLLGVTGKSAQIPLYVWLPDAMAGPTPVSALIHAATMVTAGVYLIARSYPLYNAVPAAQSTVAWVGAITAIFAATIAVAQFDIKKVLAYSTISQLGFMVAAVGMGAYVAGMFHLITHAFFKALLFLAAGSVILGVERGQEAAYGHSHDDGHGERGDFDPQDMRNMGGLRTRMPITFWVYLVGVLAISGIAPLSGFFSKDEILAAASQFSPAIFILLLLAAFLTAFYMGRQIFMVFAGSPRTRAAGAASESRSLVTTPLVLLAILSVVSGILNLPGVHSLEHWLEHTIAGLQGVEFNIILAGVALLVSLAGLGIAWLLYGRKSVDAAVPQGAQRVDPIAARMPGLFRPLANKWWVDEIYHATFVRGYQGLAWLLAYPVDHGFIDGIVNGLGYLSRGTSQLIRKAQTGFVRSYALVLLFGVVVILSYLIFAH